jgi:hypothetical protein
MTYKHLVVSANVMLFLFCFSNANAQLVSTIAGGGLSGYSGNGVPATASTVMMHTPDQIAVDASGNFYFADENNYVIRKISSAGIITTIAGTGTAALTTTPSGVPATSTDLQWPSGAAVDASGNVFICDNGWIRKISTAGILTTIAGTGTPGYSGDNGPATAAQLADPSHLSFDPSGNLYFADFTNNCIRKINATGIISTVAGKGPSSGGFSGDNGPATNAQLLKPRDVTFDAAGNMYILDAFNSVVRKVNTSGIIKTVAGNQSLGPGYTGDWGPATAAQLYTPTAIAMDATGNLYIGDDGNSVIRRVSTTGIISTIVGTGVNGWNSDGLKGPATEIAGPYGIVIYSNNVYFSDAGNDRIRKVSATASLSVAGSFEANDIELFPNPNNGSFELSGYVKTSATTVKMDIEDMTGNILFSDDLSVSSGIFNKQINKCNNLPPGLYIVKLLSENGNSILKFNKQ